MALEKKKIDNITIENARIIFRNFSGKGSKFNPEGKRNFCVVLDNDLASVLEKDGWNIRRRPPRDEDEEPFSFMSVACSYDHIRPNIYIISGGKKTLLDEDTVGTLDYAEITNVDLTIRPHIWAVGDKEGIKAYVKNMYVTIEDDPLGRKYNDMDDEDIPF